MHPQLCLPRANTLASYCVNYLRLYAAMFNWLGISGGNCPFLPSTYSSVVYGFPCLVK